MEKEILLEVKNLKKYFPVKNFFGVKIGDLKAVDDVSFVIYRGETFGLVGESGCGKTTVGRALVRLYKPTAGQILYRGEDIASETPIIVYPRDVEDLGLNVESKSQLSIVKVAFEREQRLLADSAEHSNFKEVNVQFKRSSFSSQANRGHSTLLSVSSTVPIQVQVLSKFQ